MFGMSAPGEGGGAGINILKKYKADPVTLRKTKGTNYF